MAALESVEPGSQRLHDCPQDRSVGSSGAHESLAEVLAALSASHFTRVAVYSSECRLVRLEANICGGSITISQPESLARFA